MGLSMGAEAQTIPSEVSRVVQMAKENESHCARERLRNLYATERRVREATPSNRPSVRRKARPSFWRLGTDILRICGITKTISHMSVLVWIITEAVMIG